jgi:hypothetical protein
MISNSQVVDPITVDLHAAKMQQRAYMTLINQQMGTGPPFAVTQTKRRHSMGPQIPWVQWTPDWSVHQESDPQVPASPPARLPQTNNNTFQESSTENPNQGPVFHLELHEAAWQELRNIQFDTDDDSRVIEVIAEDQAGETQEVTPKHPNLMTISPSPPQFPTELIGGSSVESTGYRRAVNPVINLCETSPCDSTFLPRPSQNSCDKLMFRPSQNSSDSQCQNSSSNNHGAFMKNITTSQHGSTNFGGFKTVIDVKRAIYRDLPIMGTDLGTEQLLNHGSGCERDGNWGKTSNDKVALSNRTRKRGLLDEHDSKKATLEPDIYSMIKSQQTHTINDLNYHSPRIPGWSNSQEQASAQLKAMTHNPETSAESVKRKHYKEKNTNLPNGPVASEEAHRIPRIRESSRVNPDAQTPEESVKRKHNKVSNALQWHSNLPDGPAASEEAHQIPRIRESSHENLDTQTSVESEKRTCNKKSGSLRTCGNGQAIGDGPTGASGNGPMKTSGNRPKGTSGKRHKKAPGDGPSRTPIDDLIETKRNGPTRTRNKNQQKTQGYSEPSEPEKEQKELVTTYTSEETHWIPRVRESPHENNEIKLASPTHPPYNYLHPSPLKHDDTPYKQHQQNTGIIIKDDLHTTTTTRLPPHIVPTIPHNKPFQ